MGWNIPMKSSSQHEAGTYTATLRYVEPVQVPVYDENNQKTDKLEWKIRWGYEEETDDGAGREVKKDLYCSNASNSGLVEWMKMSDPRRFTTACHVNDDAMKKFCDSLIGRTYLLTYSQNKYGRVVMSSVTPLPGKVAAATGHKTAQANGAAEDDSIPF